MTRRKPKLASPRVVRVPIPDRLRWCLADVCDLVSMTENYVRELERKGEFPPRVAVRSGPEDDGGKDQFVAAEVRAWADCQDWRGMVAARQVADAS